MLLDVQSSEPSMAALSEELEAALDATDDAEATFHIRQAMQHTVALREKREENL